MKITLAEAKHAYDEAQRWLEEWREEEEGDADDE